MTIRKNRESPIKSHALIFFLKGSRKSIIIRAEDGGGGGGEGRWRWGSFVNPDNSNSMYK